MKYYLFFLLIINTILGYFYRNDHEVWGLITVLNILIMPFLFLQIRNEKYSKNITNNHSLIKESLDYFKKSYGLILLLYPVILYLVLSSFIFSISDFFLIISLFFLTINIAILSTILIKINKNFLTYFISTNGILFALLVKFSKPNNLFIYISALVIISFVFLILFYNSKNLKKMIINNN
jgi:hypothetical protein